MASCVPVVDLGKKRKLEESSNDAVSKHSDCESDSDYDFACEAPDGGNTFSTLLGKRLQSGIQSFTYLSSSSTAYVSPTKEASSNGVGQKSLASNNTPVCSNPVPTASVGESDSESDGEEAAEVEEVQPTISCASVTLSSDTDGSITKPAPSPGLTSSLKTDISTVKASYPLNQSRMVNTISDLARVRNLGNESNNQPNNSKYSPFFPLYNFTSQVSRHFNPNPPPQPPPPPPPLLRPQPPPPFNFYVPSPRCFPPFRPFFPPFLNIPPPHPPFPPPPHLNNMPFPPPR